MPEEQFSSSLEVSGSRLGARERQLVQAQLTLREPV